MLEGIVAVDRGRAIGRQGALPWHLPADLAHFKALTMGKIMIMGYTTFESIVKRQQSALIGREHWILSRHHRDWPAGCAGAERCRFFKSPTTLLEALGQEEKRGIVIGGEQIYALFLQEISCLFKTVVDTRVEGADAFLPEGYQGPSWVLAEPPVSHPADLKNPYAYSFEQWQKKDAQL